MGKTNEDEKVKGKYILVAEDDKFYASLYQKKLEQDGYSVKVVFNGKEAVEEAKKQKPDLILLDLMMPVMDGFTALQEIKNDKDLKNINVLVLSNLSQNEDKNKVIDAGAAGFIVKSDLSIQDLVTQIKKYL